MSQHTDLVLDHQTMKDIVEEVYRKFQLHTDKMSFHFEAHAIHIIVYPGVDSHFLLPNGPQDIRLDQAGQRWEWIGRSRAY